MDLWRRLLGMGFVFVLAVTGSASARAATGPSIDEAHMWNGLTACDRVAPGGPVAAGGDLFYAGVIGTSGTTSSTVEFALWPTSDPTTRQVRTASVFGDRVVSVRWDTSLTGSGYAWQARVGDGTTWSAWSSPCYFVADQAPTSAPAVSVLTAPDASGSYIYGQPLVANVGPGETDADIVRYQFSYLGMFSVPVVVLGPDGGPDASKMFPSPPFTAPVDPGATTQMQLPVPPGPGMWTLSVVGYDRSGQRGPQRDIQLFFRYQPAVSFPQPMGVYVDDPVTLSLTAPVEVSAIEYAIDGGSPVRAATTGNAVQVTLVFSTTGAHEVVFTQVLPDGSLGAREYWYVYVQEPGTHLLEAPVVQGTLTVGNTLSLAPMTWVPADAAVTFQWERETGPIDGATSATYDLTGADAGHYVGVSICGRSAGRFDGCYEAWSADVVAPGQLTAPVPTISPAPLVGRAVTADVSGWGPAPLTFTYQWMRDGAPIAGATKASYRPVGADRGHLLSVQVTGEKLGYDTVAQVSSARVVTVH